MGLRLPLRNVCDTDGLYGTPVELPSHTIEPTHKSTNKSTHILTRTPSLEPIHHPAPAPDEWLSRHSGRNSLAETRGLALNGKPSSKRGEFSSDGVTKFGVDTMKANRPDYGDATDSSSNGPVGRDDSLLIKAKRKHRDEGGLHFKRRLSAEKLQSLPSCSSTVSAVGESCSSSSTTCEIVRGAEDEEINSQTETTTSSGGCSKRDEDHLNAISNKDDTDSKSTSLPYDSLKVATKITDPNLVVSASHKLTNPIISDASLNGNILWNNLRFPLSVVGSSEVSKKTFYSDTACVNVAFDSDEFFATNGVGATGDAFVNSKNCDGAWAAAKTSSNSVSGDNSVNGATGAWEGGGPKLPLEDAGVPRGRPPGRLPRVLGGGLGALQLVCSCWRTAATCLKSSLQGERAGDVYSGSNSNIGATLTSQPHPRSENGLHHTAPTTSAYQPTLAHETVQQRSAGTQSGARMLVTEQQPSLGRGMPPHDHNHNTSLGDKDTDELDNRHEGYLFPEDNFNEVPSYDTVDRKSNSKPTFTPSPPNTLKKSFPNGFPNFNNFRNNPQGFYDNLCYDAGYASERSPEEEDLPVPFDIETLEDSSRDTTRTPEGLGEQEDEEDEDQPSQEQSIVLQLLVQGVHITTQTLMDVYPFINEGTMFDVTVEKNSRGLGLSLCGGCETKGPYAGLLRIKKLYPQMPAWLCGQLRQGDIVLEANQMVLSGLAGHEALEVLRTTKTSGIHLLVCRPPLGTLDDTCSSSPVPDHSSARDVVSSSMMGVPLASPRHLAPSPVQSVCGEFEINLTKVNGSLGFTLRKRDNSVLGHTIRTLVREPALSDGRIKPGDKILSVNNTDLCGLSHEEAIAFLRTTPETVTIRLYRDVTQTPVSPLSPSEPEDSLLKPKPLRQEARDMLSDLAFRKRASPSMSPSSGASGGHSASPGNPRRRRLQKTPTPDVAKTVVVDRFDSLVRKIEETPEGSVEGEAEESAFPGLLRADREPSPLSNRGSYASSISRESARISRNTSNASNDTNSLSESSETRRKRPNFLDLDNRQSCPRKTQFTPPHEICGSFPSPLSSSDYQFLSMGSVDSAPPLGSAHSVSPSFAHLQPAYQSVNFGNIQHQANEHNRLTGTTSDYTISGYSALDGGNTRTPDQKSGLLKWKGMMMAPEEEDATSHNSNDSATEDRQDRSENLDTQRSHRMKEVTITLQRGWNSRLGFSLQAEGGATKVVAIYAGCVAAKDGRLRIGDQVLKVNGDDVTNWETEKVIDLLRKTHGKIDLTILQQPF